MKKLMFAIVALNILGFYSCTDDFGTSEITYVKATAIYGDLDEQRNIPLNAASKELINPGKIYVSDDLLLIGEEGEGIHVYDNSDPENPTATSFIQIPFNREFYVHNNAIYAESVYDMLKIDISDKSAPRLINRSENAFIQEFTFTNANGEALIGFEYETVTEELDLNTSIWELASTGNNVFLDFEAKIIPESAVPSSFAGSSQSSIGTVNRIAVNEDYVYTISRQFLTVFKDEGNIEFKGTHFIGWDMETIYPQGDALFIGTRTSMQIINVSSPENPIEEGSFWHATACDPVLPDGDVAYVTLRTSDANMCPGDENALVSVNVSDIRNPYQIQEIPMESPFGMTLIADILYVGEGENGLKLFDATDRTHLTEIKHDETVKAYDIIAHPTKPNLILIASPNGFGQYEIDGVTEDLSLLSWISH